MNKKILALGIVLGLVSGIGITIGSELVIIHDTKIILTFPQLIETQCLFVNTLLYHIVFANAFNRTIDKYGYGSVSATIDYPAGQIIIHSINESDGFTRTYFQVNCR